MSRWGGCEPSPISSPPVVAPSPEETLPPTAAAGPRTPRPAGLGLNALVSTAGNLIYFGVVVLTTPLAINALGAEGWGIWQLVGAAGIYAQLLNLSLGTAIHYQVAIRTARKDFDGIATVFTNVRLYMLVAGVALLALLALGGRPFVDFVVAEPHQRALAWSALVVSIVITSLDFQLRLFGSVLAGLQRMDLHGALQIVGALMLFSAIWFGFKNGMTLTGFAALMTMGPGAAGALSVLAVRRLLPPGSLRLTRFDPALFRDMVSYSLSTILYTTGAVVLYQTMKLLAARACGGPTAAGHLGLAISLAQVLSVVFTPAVAVLLSRVGQLHGEARITEVPALLERILLLLGLALVPSLAFLVFDARLVFEAWVGGTEAAAALNQLTTTTRLLLVGHGFYIAALPFYFTLLGVGQHRVFGLGMFLIAILNTVIGAVVTQFWPRIEALGFVYGVLMLALVLFVTAPAALRRFPVPIPRLLWRGIVVPGLASLPGLAGLWFRPRLGRPLLDLVIDGVAFSLLCLPGLELGRRRFGIALSLRT